MHDRALGFVVRAEDEASARKAAQKKGGYEIRRSTTTGPEIPVWMDPAFVSCEELTGEGEPGVVLSHYVIL